MHVLQSALVLLILTALPVSFATAADDLDLIFDDLETKRELPKGILRKICHAESRCNPAARSRVSSAAGIFQWLDGSWQGVTRLMHQDRTICPQGCPFLLSDRFRAPIAAEVTAYSLNQIKSRIGNLIQKAGVDMTTGLYMGHFLGEGGARTFFSGFIQNPNQNAAQLFPKAAAANPTIFRNRSLAGVLNLMSQKLGQAPATTGVTDSFRDPAGKLLVDNPSLYTKNVFDTTAVVPATESEWDYQTNYAQWLPQIGKLQQGAPSPAVNTSTQSAPYVPPTHTPQSLGTGVSLGNLFNLGTTSPSYVSIQSGINYFETILGSSTRPTTSPLTLTKDLSNTGGLRGDSVSVVTLTPVPDPFLGRADSTFGSQAVPEMRAAPDVLTVIAQLIQEVRQLLQALVDLVT